MTELQQNKKKRIVFIDHLPFIGGAQLVVARHASAIEDSGYESFLVTDARSDFESIYSLPQERMYRIFFARLKGQNFRVIARLLRSVKALTHVLTLIKPDLAVSNTTRGFILLALSSLSTKKIGFIWDYDYPKWLFSLLQRKFHFLVFVSNDVKAYYGNPGNAAVVYIRTNMVDRVKSITTAQIQAFRKQYQLADDDVVIGFIGRLVDWKGARTLIEALTYIDNPKVKALIVGTGAGQQGSIDQELHRLVTDRNLQDRVIFTGHLTDTPLVYKSINVFTLTSKKPEPFASTMMEAAQTGVPIIATNIGGTIEFVRDGETGLLVPPADPTALADAIQRLINNATLKHSLIENAYQESLNFTEEKADAQLLALYNQLLS